MKNSFILFTFYALFKLIFYLNSQLNIFSELVFLDVGQGDAILITTPGNKVLIDGGGGFTVSQRLNDYFPINNCSLDAVFLTHPHADHLEGLKRLLEYCHINKVFYTPVLYESRMFEEWESTLKNMNKSPAHIRKTRTVFAPFLAGDVYKVDESGKVKLYCYWPPYEHVGKSISNINNISTVVFLDAGSFEALLTGDAEQEVLREIEQANFPFLDAPLEVYKLSHHGAKNGFKSSFWELLDPILTVISVGKDNKFGHPHKEVTDWLDANSALYKRTDLEGTIKIRYNSL